MSGRPSFPNLGFDPTPGDVDGVYALAVSLEAARERMENARDPIDRALSLARSWEGDAADEFRDYADDLPEPLEKGVGSLTDAGAALTSWGGTLQGFQDRADRLEAEAAEAQKAVDAAAEDPDMHATDAVLTGRQYQDAVARQQAAVDRWIAAIAVLTGIKDEARELQEEHKKAANEIADRLRKAGDDAPDIRGTVQKIAGPISTVTSQIAKWADVLSIVAAPIPVVGGPARAVAGATNAAAVVSGAVAGKSAEEVVVQAAGTLPIRLPRQALTGGGRLTADALDGLNDLSPHADDLARAIERRQQRPDGPAFDPDEVKRSVGEALDHALQNPLFNDPVFGDPPSPPSSEDNLDRARRTDDPRR